jgi:hypothetical protein
VQRFLNRLSTSGFQEIQNGDASGIENRSGIGTRIFWNQEKQVVAKLGNERAYHYFVQWAMERNECTLPIIYAHEIEDNGQYEPWTLTIMERLHELSPEESTSYSAWQDEIFKRLRDGEQIDSIVEDPFGLLKTIDALFIVAKKSGVGIDLSKASNLMIRVTGTYRKFVITDPFMFL